MTIVQVYPSGQFPTAAELSIAQTIELLRRVQAANVAVTTVTGLDKLVITIDRPQTTKEVLGEVKDVLQAAASGTGLTKEASAALLQKLKDFAAAQKAPPSL
jgi:hypothetical protein